jgi:hypothetical protein
MLTYADVCWHMLRQIEMTYADVCWCMLAYASDRARQDTAHAGPVSAGVCWRMLVYADVC